jgi:hypothetical protein
VVGGCRSDLTTFCSLDVMPGANSRLEDAKILACEAWKWRTLQTTSQSPLSIFTIQPEEKADNENQYSFSISV